jgi:hypothetical protein
MKNNPTIVEAVADKQLFASHFKDRWFGPKDTWRPWRTFLSAAFALPIDGADLALFKQCTGLDVPPAERVKECWLVCGRRSGKSRMLALIAAYLATMVDWSNYLSEGEPGVVQIVAGDRAQAQVIFRFLSSFLKGSKVLKPLIGRQTVESIELKNGISIEIATASFKTIRGRTVVAALLDELAFWSIDGANPDSEIVPAIRPSMLTIPNSMLLVASSPYAQRGALWDAYRRYFGKPGKVLVWQSATTTMNPTIAQSEVDAALEEDPEKNKAEYLAQFRTDIESFIDRALVESLVVPGRIELAPVPGIKYHSFVDPASGSGKDSMTLSIAHKDPSNGLLLVDAIREAKPPFSPRDVVGEFSLLLDNYGITRVVGDSWGKDFVRQSFEPISYQFSDWTTAEIYLEILGRVNSRRVQFLDNQRFVTQFCNLERRTGRSGRDSVTHPNGEHDDVANAVAGALLLADAPDARIKWCAVSADGVIYDGATNHQTTYQPPPNILETY